jgi:thiol-disulfide isomerase/thioredoxin
MALGLAVVVGCAKKQTESVTVNVDPPPPPKKGGPGRPDEPVTDKTDPKPGGGWTSGVVPSAGKPNATNEAGGGMEEVRTEATESSPDKTGTVELVQCRFDKVEKALTAAKGKVVLVDCWARWCPPCIESFPKLVEKHEKYGPKGLVCMSVSIDSGRNAYNPTQVHAFLKEKKATFQNFYLTDLRGDGAAMDARLGQFDSIPHAILFNKKGEMIWAGHPMTPALVSKIEAELAK